MTADNLETDVCCFFVIVTKVTYGRQRIRQRELFLQTKYIFQAEVLFT